MQRFDVFCIYSIVDNFIFFNFLKDERRSYEGN